MAILKNVVQIGATGNLGPFVLAALKSNPQLSVKVLARPGSAISTNPPADIAVETVPFDDKAALVAAFRGTDAVVSTIGHAGLVHEPVLIEAAIEAGVKRYIPSEFGSDLDNERAREQKVYGGKLKIRYILEEKAREGKIEWTALSNSGFLDWCLAHGFLGPNLKTGVATLYDGGKRKVSFTLLEDVAKAVVGILLHPEETKNRLVYVHSARVTLEEITDHAEKVLERRFERKVVDTEDVQREAKEKIARGDHSGFFGEIMRVLYGPGYGSDFEGRVYNELFGIPVLDDAGVEAVVRKVYASQ